MSENETRDARFFLKDEIWPTIKERNGVVVVRPSEQSLRNVQDNAYGFGYYWNRYKKPNVDWQNDLYYQSLFRAYSPFTGPDCVERLKSLVEGKNILLVGCGAGHELPLLQSLNPAHICALDIGDSVYRAAETYGKPNVFFYECDLMKAEEVFSAKFDMIFTAGVLHHTYDPLYSIYSLTKLLKEGGYLNVLTLSSDSPTGKLYEMGNVFRTHFFSKTGNTVRLPLAHLMGFGFWLVFHLLYLPLNALNRNFAQAVLPGNDNIYKSFKGAPFETYANVALDYIVAPVYDGLTRKEIRDFLAGKDELHLEKLTMKDYPEDEDKQNWRISIRRVKS